MEEDPGKLINSIWSQELDLPPSCVEFCPAHPSYFLVGTYNLQKDDAEPQPEKETKEGDDESSQPAKPKKTQSRNGSILVFQLQDNNNIVPVQTEPQPSALLDLHFNPNERFQDICATVSSTATLAIFRFSPGPGEDKPLKHLHTMDIEPMSGGEISASEGSEILFLSVCWHPSRYDMLAVTTNTGYVYLVHLPAWDRGWKLHAEPAITHTLEAWTVNLSSNLGATDSSDDVSFRIFSGGDDSKLRYGTVTWNPADDIPTETISAVEARGHDAGVTAILPLFVQEDGSEVLVTGSYDENIRLFSLAPYGRPKNLVEMGLGGGVWRLKLIDLDQTPNEKYRWRARILASCMHTGSRVVDVLQAADGEHHIQVLGRFEDHKSMNYGSDFYPARKDKLTVVSTSFYDRLLCLWQLELP
ncbi:hypothetical protein QBC40DRAFT_270155 [Triangularia verruculosa]|uniref:Diphthine methyltransferase n=1 Tax=Triangularia verruculosa TaxID=2587418 RepID=A0AAN7AP94_9PEZI|nr:hypothetical protein QBC40DRAFT_270155 [Triangularia verruculosa]